MSFGLLTAINVEDIPKILHRCAHGWRGGVYNKFPHTWKVVANEVDRFAEELAIKIEEAKKTEPKPRVFLNKRVFLK